MSGAARNWGLCGNSLGGEPLTQLWRRSQSRVCSCGTLPRIEGGSDSGSGPMGWEQWVVTALLFLLLAYVAVAVLMRGDARGR